MAAKKGYSGLLNSVRGSAVAKNPSQGLQQRTALTATHTAPTPKPIATAPKPLASPPNYSGLMNSARAAGVARNPSSGLASRQPLTATNPSPANGASMAAAVNTMRQKPPSSQATAISPMRKPTVSNPLTRAGIGQSKPGRKK